MNKILVGLALLIYSLQSFSQGSFNDQPRLFFSTGLVLPQLYGGEELLSALDLRQAGLSYFQNENGERSMVGEYSQNSGFSLSIGYYLPIRKIEGLGVGLLVNSGQTGATPADGGYAEGYFFNFLNFGLGAQYYPFSSNQLYAKVELGMGSVFTKNRFLNERSEQDFLHHFGIGVETGAALGYTFHPFGDGTPGLNIEVLYQYYSTRVEVTGIGNDIWRFGAWHFSVGLQL